MPEERDKHSKTVAVIGGGPAGLMAAECLARAGVGVVVHERKPSLGRKLLMAGRGGLNLTHSEPLEDFLARYGRAERQLTPAIENFTPGDLRKWCEELGEEVFTGSSGRVFPKSMKASPLLRKWQARLASLKVEFRMQHEWKGWDEAGNLVFTNAEGETARHKYDATVLALGGASWPRLGSDGGWVKILADKNIPIAPLAPANCGFTVAWSDVFRQKFAGQPLKPVILTFGGRQVQGEAMMTERGIEGGAVYALSGALREHIAASGPATLLLDLRPGVKEEALREQLGAPRQAKSFTNFLRKAAGLSPIATSLLRETQNPERLGPEKLGAAQLAALIKALPLRLDAPFPIDRAISSAGGVRWEALDENFMLKNMPGTFAIGEMLDWEAPTGGYLLQACFSTAVMASRGVLGYLR